MEAAPEQAIASALQHADYAQAAHVGIEAYGPEILGYLVAVARSETDGMEAFSIFCEDLWRGLAEFRLACSFRTWAYTLARHALSRLRREAQARRRREVPISAAPEVMRLAERVRTTTQMHLRTEAKSRLARLRATLDPDEQTLLILRLDRRLPWRDVAQIMLGQATVDDDELRAEAVKLRKRYSRAKERLRTLIERDDELVRPD